MRWCLKYYVGTDFEFNVIRRQASTIAIMRHTLFMLSAAGKVACRRCSVNRRGGTGVLGRAPLSLRCETGTLMRLTLTRTTNYVHVWCTALISRLVVWLSSKWYLITILWVTLPHFEDLSSVKFKHDQLCEIFEELCFQTYSLKSLRRVVRPRIYVPF